MLREVKKSDKNVLDLASKGASKHIQKTIPEPWYHELVPYETPHAR